MSEFFIVTMAHSKCFELSFTVRVIHVKMHGWAMDGVKNMQNDQMMRLY